MPNKPPNFKTWMDDMKLRAEDVAGPLRVSIQTIHNWRATGVPKRQHQHVCDLMASWNSFPDHPLGTIPLRCTAEQFDQWNRVAMEEGLTIAEWAKKGLDDLAETHFAAGMKAPAPVIPDRVARLRLGK